MTWGRAVGLVAASVLVAGCYTLQPVRGVPPEVGARVALDVNDAGRVALGGTMGPAIAQVEGELMDRSSESYLLSVSGIRLVQGGMQVWSGEPVLIQSGYVSSVYQRRFSAGRSVALGVVGFGGFGAFLVKTSLFGFGTHDDGPGDDPGGDPPGDRLGRP